MSLGTRMSAGNFARFARPALLLLASLALGAEACGPPPPETGTVINRRYTAAHTVYWTEQVCVRYERPLNCYCDTTPSASYYTWSYIHAGYCVSSDFYVYGNCEQDYGYQQCVAYQNEPRSRFVPDRWELQLQKCDAKNKCKTNWIDVTHEDYDRTMIGDDWGGMNIPAPDAGNPQPATDASVPTDAQPDARVVARDASRG